MCIESVKVFANIVFMIINVIWMHNYRFAQQELLESNTLLCVDGNLFLKIFVPALNQFITLFKPL